jgi:hypothetical protein
MRVDPLAAGLISAFTLSALLVARSKGPTSPGIARPNATGSALPIRVEIVGPSSVAPGETVQFSMLLRLSDGTSSDVTNEAS